MIKANRRWRVSPRDLLIQIALIAFLVLVIGSAIRSAQVNLTALGITSGFDFLERATGWSYSFSLIEHPRNPLRIRMPQPDRLQPDTEILLTGA
ncbi:MAG: hypothetical protein AAF441_09925 [Pseudomonadota bacterium]